MPKELTYGDLFDQIGTRGPRPFLHCPACDARYSANAGDYWDRDKREVIRCVRCEEPLMRVREEIRLVEA